MKKNLLNGIFLNKENYAILGNAIGLLYKYLSNVSQQLNTDNQKLVKPSKT